MLGCPCVRELRSRTRRVTEMLVYNHRCFDDVLNELMSSPIRIHDIRCSLDTKRLLVSSPQREPMMMSDLTVSATPDLGKILHGIQSLQQRTEHHLPLLVDENIHRCLLKLIYSMSYVEFNVPMFLNRTPVLFGVWHLYKYCGLFVGVGLFLCRIFVLL